MEQDSCTHTVFWGGILEEIATLIRAGKETRSEALTFVQCRFKATGRQATFTMCRPELVVCMLQSMMKQGYHSGGFIGANHFSNSY